MLTTSNRKIINTLNKQSRKQEKEQNDAIEASYSNKEIINKTYLDNYLQHVMLRLYSNFHINISKGYGYKDDIQKVSVLAHLGMVNLHLTPKHVHVTLTSFGKAVMKNSQHKECIIRVLLKSKDVLSKICSFVIVLTLFGGLLLIMCKPDNNFIDLIGGISIAFGFVSAIIGLITFMLSMSVFRYHYRITISSILSTCQRCNGQSQKLCEMNYIIRYYRKMLKSNKFSSGITMSNW